MRRAGESARGGVAQGRARIVPVAVDETAQSDEQAVKELNRAWNEVYLRNERSAFAAILADEFCAQSADGQTGSKADMMRPTPDGAQVTFSEEEAGMQMFPGTAVTWGRIRIQHPDRIVDQRFVRLYLKREMEWRAVFVFVSPVAPEQ